MKKFLIFITLLLFAACSNKEIDKKEYMNKDEKKVEEKEELVIEKISSIESIIININLDMDLFREKLNMKLASVLEEEEKMLKSEETAKRPHPMEMDSKSFETMDNMHSGSNIGEELKTKEDFISYIKFYYSDMSVSFSEKEAESIISEVLVEIYEGQIIENLKTIKKYKDIQNEFVAIYIVPNNDFTEINALLAISNMKFALNK